MTPGPTLILQPPGCNCLLQYPTLESGNTFGARYWSDGKCEAPMLPDQPELCKSPSEKVLFWIRDCKVIAEWDFFSDTMDHPEWKTLEIASTPSEADYFRALSSGVAKSKKQILYVRMHLWWRGNDRRRKGKHTELPEKHIVNLTELEKILSAQNKNERLLKAEALRELSRFEEALALLNEGLPENAKETIAIIRDLAEKSDPSLVEIQ